MNYYFADNPDDGVPEKIRGYNWAAAFEFAGSTEFDWNQSGGVPVAVAGFAGSTDPFSRRDVAEVIAASDGERDGPDWLGVFKLKDGRFASLSAGCDYTGWDCRAGGGSRVAGSREDIIRLGLTHEERQRLGLLLPGEANTTGGEA